jgi:GNAT superfamily N-acetyltransferase
MTDTGIGVYSKGPGDQNYLGRLWKRAWGGHIIWAAGKAHDLRELPTLLASWQGRRAGAVSYRVAGYTGEIVSLNAYPRRRGVGRALLLAAEKELENAGARLSWLITSNDNVDAVVFYQRLGYRLLAVHPGAIDRARLQKPAIPRTGHYGIELHDEWVFVKALS